MNADWLEMLLNRWGRWAVRRESSALGYGSVSPMFRDAPCGDGCGCMADPGFTPRDILDCDAAIIRLPHHQRRVVVLHYKRGCGLRQTARESAMSFSAVRDALSFAKGALHVMLDKQRGDNQNNY